MAQSTTLQELKDRALDYADMVGSEFPDDSRLTDYINAGLAELQELLISEIDSDYLQTSVTVNVVGGQLDYPLPTDFFRLTAAFQLSGDRRYPINKWSPVARLSSRLVPTTSGTVELWYVPEFKKLVFNTDIVDVSIPVGWEDFVALHAAIRLLVREESDPSALAAERDRQKARIVRALAPRDAANAEVIEDIYESDRTEFYSLPRSFQYRLVGNNIQFYDTTWYGV